MNPTIPLITMACCALVTACSSVPNRARVGDVSADPDLASFYLPRVHVQNATLEEALETIRKDFEGISRRCGEKPRTLRFVWNGTPERQVSASFEDVPVLTAIRRLALQAGMKATAEGNQITLTEFARDRSQTKRALPVAPTFLTDIDATQDSLERVLRRTGALTSTDATVRYDPRHSYLTVRSSGADLARSAEFVDITTSQRPPDMVKLEVKRLALQHARTFPTGIHSPDQTERWLRKAMTASEPSVLDTLPSGSPALPVLAGPPDDNRIHQRRLTPETRTHSQPPPSGTMRGRPAGRRHPPTHYSVTTAYRLPPTAYRLLTTDH